jgi:predicted N-acetyltransferase YhbS
MSITYRDGVPGDARALDRLFDTVFCETFGHLYRPEDLDAFLTSYGIADWERDLADRACAFRVAEMDGRIVGYVKLGPVEIPVETSRPALLLDQIYVAKDHHGASIAGTLMEWTFEEAARRGAEELYLTVFIDNHRANRFYDRYGFEAVGRYDFMVGEQADHDIIMRKTL